MEAAVALLWMLSGALIHIIKANEMKTWCGTPVWREPTTYMMFVAAMIAGPSLLIVVLLTRSEKSH